MNSYLMKHKNGDTKRVFGRKEMAALLSAGYIVVEYSW
jgi:hypothetical protein